MNYTLRILQSQLGDAASQALLAMCALSEGGLCIATQREIAEARGVSYTAIKRPVRQLQGCGVVEMVKNGVYRIDLSHLPTEKVAQSDQKDAQSDQKVTESTPVVAESDQKDAQSDHPALEKDPFPLPPFLPPSSPCIPNNPPIIPPSPIPQKACSAWKTIFGLVYGFPCCALPDDHAALSPYQPGEWRYDFAHASLQGLQQHGMISSVVQRQIDRDGKEDVIRGWADTFRKLHDLDGYSQEEIKTAMRYLFHDAGGAWWRENKAIRSAASLRKTTQTGDQTKFEVLLTQSTANDAKREEEQPEWKRQGYRSNRERLAAELAAID